MKYKKNYKEVLNRLTEFYTKRPKDKIYAVMNIPNPALIKYSKENIDGETTYPNPHDRIKLWDEICSNYINLEDDSLPLAYLSEFDEGLYGGLIGGEVRFLNNKDSAWISSMTVPFIDNLEDALKFNMPDKDNEWYKTYINQLEIYKANSKDKFGVSHFIMIDQLNFLFEIRGATNSYYDILENTEVANKVSDFSMELCRKIQNDYFEHIGLFEGGTCSNMIMWAPGKIVSESVDPFHLTSPEMFVEIGLPFINRVLEAFDGCAIHIHGNGYYLVENVSKVEKITAIYLLDDDYNEYAINQLDTIIPKRNSVPLIITVDYDRFLKMLENQELPGNCMYNVINVPSVDLANEAMKKVKTYKAIFS